MEGELWEVLYRVVTEEASRRPASNPRVTYPDRVIATVLLWAALHDRPVSWACREKNWAACPADRRPAAVPSPATMSRRLRTVAVLQLVAQVIGRLGDLVAPPLVRRVDGKPLPVGGRSKDRDARWGQAVDHKARGYKAFLVWGRGVVPDAWTLGPMSAADPDAGREMVPRLSGGGYLLGDARCDSNPLHGVSSACGFQLVAPRKEPGTGLGHRGGGHEPGRLRSIGLLERPAPGDLPSAAPSPFARDLYARRADIERELGGWCAFGGGLQGLPSWARTPHRVAYWVAAKLLVNGLRLCRLRGLAA
jgi:hypothetical protein